jgi:hypothetical protein
LKPQIQNTLLGTILVVALSGLCPPMQAQLAGRAAGTPVSTNYQGLRTTRAYQPLPVNTGGDFPRSHCLALLGQPPLLQSLSLTINEEIRFRITYSALLPRLAPETVEQFVLDQLDRAGLGHNTFTPEALALIVRSGEGLLRRTRNLCLGSLIEAVRDQTRIVDLKQVNRVLIQPHWRKDCDSLAVASPLFPPPLQRESEGRRPTPRLNPHAGRAGKSGPPVWHRWRRCSKSANFNSSPRTRAISSCPLIPGSSSKTAIGAGLNDIWPAMPLTSASGSSACLSTMPCA